MVNYWRHQTVTDVAAAAAIDAALWLAPQAGIPTVFTVDAPSLAMAARTWLGQALTLLGMMSATTAFIFTVVDRTEFTALRSSRSEGQLWRVFSQNLLWLGVAALFCVSATFWSAEHFTFLAVLGTFIVAIASISVAKFVWTMRQIISVRIAQSGREKVLR
jgi:hypothetical protein